MCISYLSLGQLRLDARPSLALSGIGKQVHHDRRLANRLIDIEQVLARDPTILLSLLPRGTVLSHTDNDVQSVVAEIETLTVTLRTITDEGQSVVLEVVLAPS